MAKTPPDRFIYKPDDVKWLTPAEPKTPKEKT